VRILPAAHTHPIFVVVGRKSICVPGASAGWLRRRPSVLDAGSTRPNVLAIVGLDSRSCRLSTASSSGVAMYTPLDRFANPPTCNRRF
jgi:hypothetical protein